MANISLKNTVNELIRIFLLNVQSIININNPSSSTSDAVTITNAAAMNALVIDQNGDAGASTSTGGAVLIENSGNVGSGLVIFSSNGATQNGTLLAVRCNNAAFDQKALAVDYTGTGDAVLFEYKSTAVTTGECLNVVSANTLGSAMGIQGTEEGHGTLKIVHAKPTNADTNAAAISIEINGASTACQGIYLDSDQAAGTTGDLIDMRCNNAATQLHVVNNLGNIKGKSAAADPTAAEIAAGYYDVYKHTGTNVVSLWYNDGGTLKKVSLT